MICDCCGDQLDGLFPLVANKADEDHPELTEDHSWCGLCFEQGDCKGPYGGACYRHEITGQENWDGYYG